LVIDVDAHVLVCRSEKEQTAPTFEQSCGHHPLLAYSGNTGGFLAAQLRPGIAGSNAASDACPAPSTSGWSCGWMRGVISASICGAPPGGRPSRTARQIK
jgi:hypothetical protein